MKEKVYVSGPMNFTRTALENLTKPLAVLLLFLGLLNIFIGMMENDIVTILWGAIGPLFSYIFTTLPEAQNQILNSQNHRRGIVFLIPMVNQWGSTNVVV